MRPFKSARATDKDWDQLAWSMEVILDTTEQTRQSCRDRKDARRVLNYLIYREKSR